MREQQPERTEGQPEKRGRIRLSRTSIFTISERTADILVGLAFGLIVVGFTCTIIWVIANNPYTAL